jgi:hypothetical protein
MEGHLCTPSRASRTTLRGLVGTVAEGRKLHRRFELDHAQRMHLALNGK